MAEALLAQERHDYEQKLRDMELAQLQDLMRGPALSVQSGGGSIGSGGSGGGRAGTSSRGYSGEWTVGKEGYCEDSGQWQESGASGGSVTVPIAVHTAAEPAPPQDGNAKLSSFATITQVRIPATATYFSFSFFSVACGHLTPGDFCPADGWKLSHAGSIDYRAAGDWQRGQDRLGHQCSSCSDSTAGHAGATSARGDRRIQAAERGWEEREEAQNCIDVKRQVSYRFFCLQFVFFRCVANMDHGYRATTACEELGDIIGRHGFV
jgi:hypothetical protein